MDHFCYLCFVCVMFFGLFIAALWSADVQFRSQSVSLTLTKRTIPYTLYFRSQTTHLSEVKRGLIIGYLISALIVCQHKRSVRASVLYYNHNYALSWVITQLFHTFLYNCQNYAPRCAVDDPIQKLFFQ